MFIYGKTSANAISVMSYLAALPENQLADTKEIAASRGISRALTAKLLTQLARANLAEGQAGIGGGYRLSRPADAISLRDIVAVFEQTKTVSQCPFGREWCGNNNPCPMHDAVDSITKANHEFMNNTRLSLFSTTESQTANAEKITSSKA